MKEDENYINFIRKLKSKITQNKDNNIVFCCIGTDRVIGDCIGPITGSLLKGVDKNFNVYGDLNENLTFSIASFLWINKVYITAIILFIIILLKINKRKKRVKVG